MKFLISILTFFAVRSLRSKLKDITKALEKMGPHCTVAGYHEFCWNVREHNSGQPKHFKFYAHGLFIKINVKDSMLVTRITTGAVQYTAWNCDNAIDFIKELDLEYIVENNYRQLYGVTGE